MLKLVLLCLAGVILVRLRIIPTEFLKPLSRVTITLFLPCLLITKIGQNFSIEQLSRWWIIPVSALLYFAVGSLLGILTRPLFCSRKEFGRFYVVSCSQSNAGYLPMMLIVTICQLTPELKDVPNSGDIGIACVALYLFAFIPTLWGWAFPYVSGHKFELRQIHKILNPPMVAAMTGAVIGLLPSIKGLFWAKGGAPLSVVADSAEMISECTIPCAMIILGGNLSKGPDRGAMDVKTVAGVSLCRLLLMPLFGLVYVLTIMHLEIGSNDPIVLLVILIAPGAPPALNLIVMSQTIGRHEKSVASLLFWAYLFSLVTLTIFVTIALYIVFHG